jgi:hypothetical protein
VLLVSFLLFPRLASAPTQSVRQWACLLVDVELGRCCPCFWVTSRKNQPTSLSNPITRAHTSRPVTCGVLWLGG